MQAFLFKQWVKYGALELQKSEGHAFTLYNG
jgi:hypothetical protein